MRQILVFASLLLLTLSACSTPCICGTTPEGLTIKACGNDTTGTVTVTDSQGGVVFEGTVHRNPQYPNDGAVKNASGEQVGTLHNNGDGTVSWAKTDQSYTGLPDSTTVTLVACPSTPN
ncbi:MAG: hypothetical protein J5J06_19760 [Phycisphaerae bacterium]|nr:hypothetical protein [Phycisphaerae bacterium]